MRPDAGIVTAEDANYPTAEFYACGKHWHGLGFCSIEEGKSLEDVYLSVQGYYAGTVRFASTCNTEIPVPDSIRYANSSKVYFPLPGNSVESCSVSFVVSPEYPSEQSQALKISSFKGHLWIRMVKKDMPWMGFASKIAQADQSEAAIAVPISENLTQVDVAMKSVACEINFGPSSLPVANGQVIIPMKLLAPVKIKNCVINGVVFNNNDNPLRITWLVAGYDTRFVPLPIPQLDYKDNQLTVTSDGNVSITALDSNFEISNIATFDFQNFSSHTLRMLTVGGRSIIGDYSPQTKAWTWIY